MRHELPLATVELPEGWEDRSSYQFMSPADEGLDVPLARGGGRQVQADRVSVMISRLPLEKGHRAEELIRAQREGFKQGLPGVTKLQEGEWPHPKHGRCAALAVTFEPAPAQRVTQVHVFVPRSSEQDVVNVTFTVMAQSYERRERELRRIFETLEVKGV